MMPDLWPSVKWSTPRTFERFFSLIYEVLPTLSTVLGGVISQRSFRAAILVKVKLVKHEDIILKRE